MMTSDYIHLLKLIDEYKKELDLKMYRKQRINLTLSNFLSWTIRKNIINKYKRK